MEILRTIPEPMATTIPVLTEALHFLQSTRIGARRLMDFVAGGGVEVLFLDEEGLGRAFALMARRSDTPMDFADASLVVAAERHRLQSIFTVDKNDIATYRIQRGHRLLAFNVVVAGRIHVAAPDFLQDTDRSGP